MKTIPNELKKFRLENNLTQKQVADKLGFKSYDRICRWEKGTMFPHPINLLKLSVIYKTLPHELYGELMEKVREDVKM